MSARPIAVASTPVPETDSTIRLAEAARAGDRASFAALYTRFHRVVHGIVMTKVPRGDVEDVVQDVFILAMERLPGLRDAAAFPGWLAAIARNRAVDSLRRTRPTTELQDMAAPSSGDGTEALAVLAAIRSLSPAYSETLTLRLVEGLTGPEIAEYTGMTEGSVRVNLHRGMKQLRERLEGGLP